MRGATLALLIGGCDVVLMDMQERDPGRATIQMVLNAAERGAQVTRNLLTFSRKQVVRTQVNDLNEVILSAEPLIAQLIREDIRFSVDLTNDRLPCMTDGTQIEQVLMNLAANARDAMTEGGRFLISSRRIAMDAAFIRSHGFGRDGEYAALRLEDTGSGMDETTRQRIFEPFFTTKGVGKGTGLGLASVFGIVKQHNGYIDVASEPGRGTVFSIYLPLIAASAAASGTQPSTVRRLSGSETLLVAEDEALVRSVITQILTRAGYRVVEACDGEDAESKFREHGDEIDLVLLDVIMPGKNGKQAYESIQKMRPGMKCLFMSGYTGDIISSSGISPTEADFLQKPVPPALLLMKVRELLGGSPIQ